MAVYVSEAELLSNALAILDRVAKGTEFVIERDGHPVAILSPVVDERETFEVATPQIGRKEEAGVIDEDFARDVEDGIRAHRQPWDPPLLD